MVVSGLLLLRSNCTKLLELVDLNSDQHFASPHPRINPNSVLFFVGIKNVIRFSSWMPEHACEGEAVPSIEFYAHIQKCGLRQPSDNIRHPATWIHPRL